MRLRVFAILILPVLFYSCDKNPAAPDYQKEITVFGYIQGNASLDQDHAILVAYTQPISQSYDIDKAAIRNARVTLTEAGSQQSYELRENPAKPGFYYNDQLLIKPKATYTLSVRADGVEVTATTTVPPEIGLTTDLRADTVNYVHHKNLSREMPIFVEDENPEQVVLVDMFCNESWENAEYITPFHNHTKPDDQEEYDGGVNGEPRHIQGMGKYTDFTSANYPGQHVIDWYSSMLVFYGSYTMMVHAIDDNYHKHIYTENPDYNGGVHNGLGVFGSYYGQRYEMVVVKEE
jgi:hypothetical protein